MLNFGDFFPDPKMVALEQNYRSVTSILDAANGVIANNATRHEKKLWSRLGKGSPVIAAAHASDISEADYIVRRIKKQAEMQQRPLDNFAVLYRSNSQTRVLEEALKQHAVPYRLLGGSSVFDRREVKDVVAYLRLVLNPRDEMAIRRVINVPTRGVGATSLSTLDQRAKAAGQRLTETVRAAMTDGTLQNRAVEGLERFYVALDAARERIRGAQPSELPAITKQLLVDIGMETYVRTTEKNPRVADVRWRIVEELLDRLGQAEGSSAFSALDDYISVLALDTSAQNETAADHVGKVVLSTLHSSKGLEFPVVYMCGMSEGTLPHENAIKEGSAGVSEERRLCYVGMTRAKESLVLTRPRYVLLRGQKIPREPSRFLDEIPPHLLHELDQQQNAAALAAKAERNLEHLAKLKAMLDD
ncbi:MAG: DNA helicase-2/ATP-dependent DNA helicase PcrA [Bradymonadia bacterium]